MADFGTRSYLESFEEEFHGKPLGSDSQLWEMNIMTCPSLFRGDVGTFNKARQDHPDWIPLMYRWNFRGDEKNPLDLRGADLRNVDLRGAKFSHVNLAGVSFVGSLMRTVEFEFCDLQGTDFSGMDFEYGEFHWCNMAGAQLPGISAPTASFYDSNLTGANLRDADLHLIMRFWNLNLTRADLRGANLRSDSFRNNEIEGVQVDAGQALAIFQRQFHELERQLKVISRQLQGVLKQDVASV